MTKWIGWIIFILFFVRMHFVEVVLLLNVVFGLGVYPLWNPYIFLGMPSFGSLQLAPFMPLFVDMAMVVLFVFVYMIFDGEEG